MPSPAKDNAQTKANVDTKFQQLVEGIQKIGRAAYQAWMGTGQRKWDIPEQLADKDVLEIADMHKPAFERDDLNSKFKECIQNPTSAGTTGDLQAISRQVDYIAEDERAYRSRHATLVRCLAHAAGRSFGQGESNVQPAILRNIESLIKAGGAQ